MKWHPITEVPKQPNKEILFVEYYAKWDTFISEFIGTYEDAMYYREYKMKNDYTHWAYLTMPNNT